MAGINLSQTDNSAAPGFFDKGTVTGMVLLLVMLSLFGGLRWYVGSLEKQSQSLDAMLAGKKAALEGEKVNHLADVNNRALYLAKNETQDSQDIFIQLEQALIPAVALSSLRYHSDDRMISFRATTGSFKTLAQQIETLQNTGMFSEVRTKEIVRNPEGGISFSLDTVIETPDKK